jgi:hypothetical protein
MFAPGEFSYNLPEEQAAWENSMMLLAKWAAVQNVFRKKIESVIVTPATVNEEIESHKVYGGRNRSHTFCNKKIKPPYT